MAHGEIDVCTVISSTVSFRFCYSSECLLVFKVVCFVTFKVALNKDIIVKVSASVLLTVLLSTPEIGARIKILKETF